MSPDMDGRNSQQSPEDLFPAFTPKSYTTTWGPSKKENQDGSKKRGGPTNLSLKNKKRDQGGSRNSRASRGDRGNNYKQPVRVKGGNVDTDKECEPRRTKVSSGRGGNTRRFGKLEPNRPLGNRSPWRPDLADTTKKKGKNRCREKFSIKLTAPHMALMHACLKKKPKPSEPVRMIRRVDGTVRDSSGEPGGGP